MPINVTTVYTKERLEHYNKYVSASKWWLWVIMIATTLIIAVCTVILALLDSLDGTVITYLVIVVFIDLSYLFFSFWFPRIHIKKAKNLNTEIQYTFDNESFKIQAANQFSEESSTVKYQIISKVRFNKDDMYLYISSFQAYLVDLSGLDFSERVELIELIRSKTDLKKFKL